MPWYKWYAMTAGQRTYSGHTFARNMIYLAESLAQQYDALLMYAYIANPRLTYSTRIVQQQLLYERLAQLLGAGVRLQEALSICISTCTDQTVRVILEDCRAGVDEGFLLSEVASHHSLLFSPLVVQLMRVGERAGSLGTVYAHVAQYYRALVAMLDGVRKALVTPLITGGTGLVVLLLVVCCIAPQLIALHQQIAPTEPRQESIIIWGYHLLRSPWMWGILISCGGVVWIHERRLAGDRLYRWGRWIPYLRTCMREVHRAVYLRTMGVALVGGVDTMTALGLAAEAVGHDLQDRCRSVTALVGEGCLLSEALESAWPDLSCDASARIRIGEATGTLGAGLIAAAATYEEDVARRLRRYAQIIHPILVLMLGVMVGGILCMVYEPLMRMSEVAW